MNILQEFDTITAIATPIGTGGVGVIRISGDKSFEIIEKIFSKKNLETGRISHGWIVEGDKKIDEVLVLPFRNPNSYTGEDVIAVQELLSAESLLSVHFLIKKWICLRQKLLLI